VERVLRRRWRLSGLVGFHRDNAHNRPEGCPPTRPSFPGADADAGPVVLLIWAVMDSPEIMVDMSILVSLGQWVTREVVEPFRSRPWQQSLFLGGQIVTVFMVVNWWIHYPRRLPNPGVAVLWIALVAAGMSIQPDIRGWQKAIWMIIIALLLIVETHAITKDRDENNKSVAADRKAQNDNFTEIRTAQEEAFRKTADGLKSAIAQSQQQFEGTMSKSNQIVTEASAIAKLSRQNIDAATGGESYAVVWLAEVTNNEASFTLVHKGDYALRSLRLNFSDRSETDRVATRTTPPPTLEEVMSTYGRDDRRLAQRIPASPDENKFDRRRLRKL
jgi:hypothetical protein